MFIIISVGFVGGFQRLKDSPQVFYLLTSLSGATGSQVIVEARSPDATLHRAASVQRTQQRPLHC